VTGDVVVVFGVVVAVVAVVVDGEVVAVEAADPVEVATDDWPDTVVAVVEAVDGEVVGVDPDADVPAVAVVTDDEWAVAPEATTSPRATAPVEAATPTATVVRRTRATARSRERAAEFGLGWLLRGGCAMADLSL
jgi:hypothetical protein